MLEDDEDLPAPILACGHQWDEAEDWEDMAVILKTMIDEPEGSRPAISTGHYCRKCHAQVKGERLASMDEAWAWLRGERGE